MFPSHAKSVALSRILLGIYFVSFLILYSDTLNPLLYRLLDAFYFHLALILLT